MQLGGLLSYGASFYGIWHRSAYYIDKLLKGAKTNELPVELPTVFDLAINLGCWMPIFPTVWWLQPIWSSNGSSDCCDDACCFPVTATTDFLAADIHERGGSAAPA